MTEIEFIEAIDCKFPYQHEGKWRQIIDLGVSISPNSAFMVLHEICRAPREANVDTVLLQKMLSTWSASFSHPLVEVVLPAASAMIRDELISVEQALSTMKDISHYQHQYNALAIPYFACDDTEGEVDDFHKKIIAEWQRPTLHSSGTH